MRIEISSQRSSDAAIAYAEAARVTMARMVEAAGHDLKQPLQVALLSIARAVGEGIDPCAAQRLAAAMDALKRMAWELDDIAGIAGRDAFPGPRFRAVSLDAIIDRAESDWRDYAELCGIALHVKATSRWVETDPGMIRSVVRSLIGNAIKLSGPGGLVQIGIRELGDRLRLEIRDTGRGIPQDQLAIIEALFAGAPCPEYSKVADLRLLIAQRTAELLGHPLIVRSLPDIGSVFSIELPVTDARRSSAADVIPLGWSLQSAQRLAVD